MSSVRACHDNNHTPPLFWRWGHYPRYLCCDVTANLIHFIMANQPFAQIVTLEEFAASKNFPLSKISVAKTTNGATLLTAMGSPVAVIQNKLKGANLQATATKLGSVNLCVGIPHPGDTDQSGRPSLPCLMESTTQWEEISLF